MIEFRAWPRTPRLFRDVVITEKIDGTNAAIIIEEIHEAGTVATSGTQIVQSPVGDKFYAVGAQSRKRPITPGSDNFGFARWVYDNASEPVKLGPGHHYGEWLGSGIQRGYGFRNGERFFSLFNTERWLGEEDGPEVPGLGAVPVLYRGIFDQAEVERWVRYLRALGSVAAPGYTDPEGICIFHTQSRQVYKVLLENDDISKTESGAA